MRGSQVHRKLIHPAGVMVSFWAVLYTVHALAPFEQRPPISVGGLLFVGSMISLFAVGSLLASSLRVRPHARASGMNAASAYRRALPFLLVGVVGGLLSIYAKIADLDLLDLAGAAALRSERAVELMDAERLSSGVLAGLAFLTYPAGFVGVVLAVSRYEWQSKPVRVLAMTYFPIVFLHSVVAGGRGTILVLLIFLGLAVYLRRNHRLPWLPRSSTLRLLLGVLTLAFVGYSMIIWQVRSALTNLSPDAFFVHAESSWEVTPHAWLLQAGEALGSPNLAQTVMSTVFYFTQCLAVIERVLAMPELPLLLGGYQIDLVAAAMRAVPAGAEHLGQGNAQLLGANVYGFFTAAWGSLLIDFGLPGSVALTLLWGWLCGRAYANARKDATGSWDTLYVYSIYSVLISFISPPLGFANSAVTLFWFAAHGLAARLPHRRSRRFLSKGRAGPPLHPMPARSA